MITAIKKENVQSIQHTSIVPIVKCDYCGKRFETGETVQLFNEENPQIVDITACEKCFFSTIQF